MKEGKVWGTTELLLHTATLEVRRLWIKPRSRCSMHVHQHRANAFLVVAGRLSVVIEKQAYSLTDVTDLGPGEGTVVPPAHWHRFETGEEPCLCFELYYPPDLDPDDITRRDVGGSSAGETFA